MATHSIHQFSPSLPLPCVTVCHQVPNELYEWQNRTNNRSVRQDGLERIFKIITKNGNQWEVSRIKERENWRNITNKKCTIFERINSCQIWGCNSGASEDFFLVCDAVYFPTFPRILPSSSAGLRLLVRENSDATTYPAWWSLQLRL